MGLFFTGNWFIDAGTVGFVRIHDEVAGLDLGSLRSFIDEDERLVYYCVFPLVYMCHYALSKFGNAYSCAGFSGDFKSVCGRLIGGLDLIGTCRKFSGGSREVFDKVWDLKITKVFKVAWVEGVAKKILLGGRDKINSGVEVIDSVLLNLYSDLSSYVSVLKSDLKLDKRGFYCVLSSLAKNDIDVNISDRDLILDSMSKIKDFLESLWDFFFNENSDEASKALVSYLDSDGISELEKIKRDYLSKRSEMSTLDRFFRLPLDSNIFKNFLFFNVSSGFFNQKSLFYDLISFDLSIEYLGILDKTINKFLFSAKEFTNIPYVELRTHIFKDNFPRLFAHLICFDKAFENFYPLGFYFFYTPDLRFTYEINKRLWVNVRSLVGGEGGSRDKLGFSILQRSWRDIINELEERHSEWVLENLYLIRYKQLSNREIVGVEYFGLDQLRALIVRDSYYRDVLNSFLSTLNKGTVWVFEEFLSKKSLFPVISSHILRFLNNPSDIKNLAGVIKVKRLLEIDEILFGYVRKRFLFSDEFLRAESKFEKIKGAVRFAFNELLGAFREVFQNIVLDRDKAINVSRKLIFSILRGDKHRYLDELLRFLNALDFDDVEKFSKFNGFLREYIILNEFYWEPYALFVSYLIVKSAFGVVEQEEDEESVLQIEA